MIENRIEEVSIKFLNSAEYSFMEQDFEYSYPGSIVNIEFTNFIEDHGSEVTGPVMIQFPSHRQKLAGEAKHVKIVQKTIHSIGKENTLFMPGRMVIACYHIGPHETLQESYDKIYRFAEKIIGPGLKPLR